MASLAETSIDPQAIDFPNAVAQIPHAVDRIDRVKRKSLQFEHEAENGALDYNWISTKYRTCSMVFK